MDGKDIFVKKLHLLLGFTLCFVAMPVFADDPPKDADDTGTSAADNSGTNDEEGTTETVEEETAKPEHIYKIAAFPEDKTIHAELNTSLGSVSCEIFAGTHPLTVLNFMSLAKGKPTWTDSTGTHHSDPYYHDLKFAGRSKNAYVMSGLRAEGTDFVLTDEQCTSHGPVAGAIAMVQPHPGMASTQFILLACDMPIFKGMYSVFGQCGPIEIIQKLTKSEAVLESIVIDE